MTASNYHKGDVVGLRGHRAVVSGINGSNVLVAYIEQLPARHCAPCLGTGRFSRRPDYKDCPACRGTGELPAGQVERVEWVRAEDLTEPPAQAEREDAAEVGAFLSNPRAVFGESS